MNLNNRAARFLMAAALLLPLVVTEAFAEIRFPSQEAIDATVSSPGAPSPNLPRGAQTMDQSAFALGSMQWNVIFVENDGTVGGAETWSAAERTAIQTEVNQAKTYWEGLTAAYHPNARLSINVNFENSGNALTTPVDPTANQSESWVNDVMGTLGYNSANRHTNVRNYNQAQRVAANSNWATTIFALDNTDNFNDSYAYAYFGGPFTILTRDPAGWQPQNFNMVLAHEMGHIFNAWDEYQASGARNTYTGGYLNGVNGNASLNGAGNPVVPPQANALMLNNGNFGTGVPFSPSPFASVQFGHRDTDLDNIPDILDTSPTLTGSDAGSNPGTGDFVFGGSISVNDITNQNPLNMGFSNSQSDMTINTISNAYYVLDAGVPVSFNPGDGTHDDYTEALGFSLLGLPAGAHTIGVYGLNSVDNQSNVLNFNFVSSPINQIPEPSTLVLAALGLLGLLGSGRRRRQR